MDNLRIEAIFGGILALAVLMIVVFAVTNTQFGRGSGPIITSGGSGAVGQTTVAGNDAVCVCYNEAFKLAAKVDVLSASYRTGFEQCRAVSGVSGGDAWTAGWNARLSAKPYEASCRRYKRRSA